MPAEWARARHVAEHAVGRRLGRRRDAGIDRAQHDQDQAEHRQEPARVPQALLERQADVVGGRRALGGGYGPRAGCPPTCTRRPTSGTAALAARHVAPAWELLERGETATDPMLRATQERLQACAHQMAHTDQDRIVPACVQHSVLDPQENTRLLQLLPRRRGSAVTRPAPDAG